MIRTATVRFENAHGKSKEYDYLTAIQGMEKGDLVVVEAGDWYQVATFERYKADKGKANKHIIQKVDLEQVEKDKEMAYKLDTLKTQMEARLREVKELEMLEKYSEKDDELKKLVEEYKEIR